MLKPIEQNVLDRFWKKVKKTDSCWEWLVSKTKGGYGQFNLDGKGDMRYAHRLSYEFLVGPIPKGMQLDHLCRNRGCVNPEHLEIVDNKTNSLRGISEPAKNARKTHCIAGHPLSGKNLYIVHLSSGEVWRRCATCHKRRNKAAKAKKRLYHMA